MLLWLWRRQRQRQQHQLTHAFSAMPFRRRLRLPHPSIFSLEISILEGQSTLIQFGVLYTPLQTLLTLKLRTDIAFYPCVNPELQLFGTPGQVGQATVCRLAPRHSTGCQRYRTRKCALPSQTPYCYNLLDVYHVSMVSSWWRHGGTYVYQTDGPWFDPR